MESYATLCMQLSLTFLVHQLYGKHEYFILLIALYNCMDISAFAYPSIEIRILAFWREEYYEWTYSYIYGTFFQFSWIELNCSIM